MGISNFVFQRFCAGLLLVLLASASEASPLLDVKATRIGDINRMAQLSKNLRMRILAGEFDAKAIEFPIARDSSYLAQIPKKALRYSAEEQKEYIRISSETFSEFPRPVQDQIIANFSTWEDNYTAYYAQIDTRQPDIAQNPLFAKVGVDVAGLPTSVGAEKLLAPLMANWAYRFSGGSGPNCAFAAFAAIFSEFTSPRPMGAQEMQESVAKFLVPIEKPEKWGDLIRFFINGDFHLFVYLGNDRARPEKQIVFTKNGFGASRYLFMDYDEVHSIYQNNFGIQKVAYYRRKDVASRQAFAFSESDFQGVDLSSAHEAALLLGSSDPLLEYGMKLHPAHAFPAIR